MKKIITHLPPAHLDDWVAVALLRHRYPTAQVERVRPQAAPAPAEGLLLVDIGQRHDPSAGCFDHHQDQNLPCAAVLVADWLGGFDGFLASPAAEFMSVKDARGFGAAVEATGYKPPRELMEVEGLVLSTVPELDGESGPAIGSAVSALLAGFTGQESYEDLVRGLWDCLPEPVRQAALDRKAAYQRELEEAVAAAKVEEIDGLTVVTLDRPWGRAGEIMAGIKARLGGQPAHLLVSPNHMGRGTSVVKNTATEEAASIDLGRAAAALGVEEIFLHATGFIAVLDIPSDEVNVRRLVKGVRA